MERTKAIGRPRPTTRAAPGMTLLLAAGCAGPGTRLASAPDMIPTKILVVDQDLVARAALVGALMDEGLEVHTASRAVEALQKVDEVTPDIVVTDIELAGMSGLELQQALRVRHDDLVVMLVNGEARAQPAKVSRLVSLVATQIEASKRRRRHAA
jgi:CheY-like chemotaxis protein